MSAQLVIHKNPFRVHLDVQRSAITHGRSVRQCLRKQQLINRKGTRICPYVVYYNGLPLLEKDWDIVIAQDAWVQVSYMPRGGGGGSNIGAILGAIAAAVMAYFTFGLSLIASAAVGVAAYAGLTLLVGAIPKPSLVNSASRESTSPTYSLSAQGNSARLLEAIPRVYGRMKTFPDLASRPYTEFQDNIQYLYQLFCVSQGKAEVESIFLDDSNINQFSDAEVQIIYPNEAVTLFPDNVVTSDSVTGQEVPSGVTVGPFTVNAPGTTVSKIGIDITLPSGAGRLDDEGTRHAFPVGFTAQYRRVDDLGNPEGPWETLVNEQIRVATQQAQFRTFYADVLDGRYQVQIIKTTSDAADTRTFGTLTWAGLRGYMASTHVYGNVTLIAVRMRATALLNQTTARKFSVISKGFIPEWDPVDGWGMDKFTANPAWVAADILRNTDYGRGLGTSRINIERLYELSKTWATREDEFNGVFDTTIQLWEAVSRVMRVGRAVPVYYAGVIDFVRDEPQSIPRAMFQPANMVENSFSSVYNFFTQESPDHVVVEYFDRETWTTEEVECVLPGGTNETPARVEIFGVTNRAHAWREGMSMAAGNRDRRRNIEFQTNVAGLIPSYNSLVRVSHDSVSWGYSGRVLNLNRANGSIIVTEQIRFDESTQNLINFRKRDGSQDGPYNIQKNPKREVIPGVGFTYTVVTTPENLASIYISDGVKEDYTFFQAGPTEREGLLALVVAVKPQVDGKVSVQCVNYAESVYSAESGGVVPAPPPGSNLPGETSRPIIDIVTVKYTTTIGEQVISATAATGAIYYEFEALPPGGTWMQLGTSADPTLRTNFAPGVWSVRVRGIGRGEGPWTTWTGDIEATVLALPYMQTFAAFSELFAIRTEFSYAPETLSIVREVEIRVGLTNVLGDSSLLAKLPYPADTYTMTNLGPGHIRYFWLRATDFAGRVGPWFNNGHPIVQRSESDGLILLEYLVGKITKTELGEDVLGEMQDLQDALTDIESLIDGLAINDYDAAQPYLKNSLVVADGSMYQAVQDVPIGLSPPNAAYWKYIGDFTTLAEGLQGLATQVTALDTKVDTMESSAREVWVMQAERRGESEGQLAGVLETWRNGASIREVRQTIVNTEMALAQQITELRTEFDGNKASVTSALEALSTEVESVAQSVLDLKAEIGEDISGQIQIINEVVAELEGEVRTSTVVKHEVTADGKTYAAGFALGLDYSGGTIESQFLVRADTFAILNQTTGASVATSPFIVQGGVAYMQTLMAKNATIGSLRLAGWLESEVLGPGGIPVLRMNFTTGEFQLNSAMAGGGRISLDNRALRVYDAANALRVELGELL